MEEGLRTLVSGFRMYRFSTCWAPDSRNTSRTRSFRLLDESTSGAIFRLWICNFFLRWFGKDCGQFILEVGWRLRDSCLIR